MTRENMARILGAVYSLTYSLYPIEMREERNALVRRALAVLFIAVGVAATDIVVISLLQPELEFMDVVMECCSAMGTVGVSAFGSASLNAVSRVLIIFTMYLGRIGPLTMALVFARRQDANQSAVQYPNGQIMIG